MPMRKPDFGQPSRLTVRQYGDQVEARRATSREVVEQIWTQVRELALAGDSLRVKLRAALDHAPGAATMPLGDQASSLLAWLEANEGLDPPPAEPPPGDAPPAPKRYGLSRYLIARLA